MPIVIPDSVLESVFCKQCFSYLTVGPIKNDQDGGHICGRCLCKRVLLMSSNVSYSSYSGMENIPESLLLYAGFPEIKFPCVNHFEGCCELMPFSDVRYHESNCLYNRKTKCRLCEFYGVGSQLVQHFKMIHKENYLSSDNPVFTLKVQGQGIYCTYLCRSGNILCWTRMEFSLSTNQVFNVTVKTSFLGSTAKRNSRTSLMLKVRYSLYGVSITHVLTSDNLSTGKGADVNMFLELPEFQHCGNNEIMCIYAVELI